MLYGLKKVSTNGSLEKVKHTPKETERFSSWKAAEEAEEDKASKDYLC